MNDTSLAQEILRLVGGSENMSHLTHCVTRLRMNLIDDKLADRGALRNTAGVLGVVESSGQFQVVLGNRVTSVYEQLHKVLNGSLSPASENARSASIPAGKGKNIFARFLEVIAGVFTPILPAIIAAGLLKGLIVLLAQYEIVDTSGTTYRLMDAVASAGFFFMPVLIGFTSGLKFNCNPYLSALLGAILLHPELRVLMESEEYLSLFGLPVKTANYAGSVLPVIISVWFMSHVEKQLSRVISPSLKTIFQPLLTILITLPFMFCIFAPLGAVAGKGIATGFLFLYMKAGVLAGALLGGAFPFIILTGMHTGFFPVMIESITQTGFDYILAIAIASNSAQAGAVFAVFLLARNKALRGTAGAAAISAVIGITEPALFGVSARLRKPLIAVSIGGAAGGAFMAWFKVGSAGIGTGPLAGMPFFFGPQFMHYVMGSVLAFTVGMVLCYVIKFDESVLSVNQEQK